MNEDLSWFFMGTCFSGNDEKNNVITIGEGNQWLEILGCGMVNPRVLNNCNIDSGGDLGAETINERRYCENYSMPNDDAEQGRLQMLHDIFLNVMGGRVSMAPLQNPQKILDIGT